MTLLSLFMTSTGIFCFVPISQRLVESGIIPTSSSWQLRRLRSVLAPTFYPLNEEKLQFLLADNKAGDVWLEADEPRQTQSPSTHLPLCSSHDSFASDQMPVVPCKDEWCTDIVFPLACSTPNSLLQSTSIDTFYGHESTSFISVTQDTTLCDSCNTLLRREIPPDHIPSVIRAFALFEAQDRLSDVALDECEVAALTNAFSMLRL